MLEQSKQRGGFVERGILTWVQATGLTLEPPPTPTEHAAALAVARDRTHDFARTAALLVLGGTAVWWFLDRAVLVQSGPVGAAFDRLRATVMVIFGVFVISHRAMRRAPLLADAALVVTLVGGVTWSLSSLGVEAPHYHTTYWLLMVPIAGLVPFRQRIALCMTTALAHWGGMFWTRPELIGHPMHLIAVSTIVALTLLAIVAGHYLYVLLLNLFVAQQRLRVHSDTLQQKVALATRELSALTLRTEQLREQDRRWVAQELHDQLGQQLTALRCKVAAGECVLNADASRGPALLSEIDAQLERVGEAMRRLTRHVRPVVLEELGLDGALRWLARDMFQDLSCEAVVTVSDGVDQLGEDVALMLFRATQEAVTNVVKHADATRVEIRLERTSLGRWRLSVSDDGAGLG